MSSPLVALLLFAAAAPSSRAPLEDTVESPAPASEVVSAAPEEGVTRSDEEDSRELDELHAAEQLTIDETGASVESIADELRGLGFAHPLRAAMLLRFEAQSDQRPVGPVADAAAFDVSMVREQFDIPLEMRPLVVRYIEFFQGAGRKWFRKWMSRSTRYVPAMRGILQERGLPRDTVYLAMIESGFSTQARSRAQAVGPWQFIAETGRRYGLRQDFWVDERRDPIKSTHAAARFLQHLYRDLGHWYLAWAGYNAGGGRLRRVVDQRGTTDFWELIEGRGLADETKHYVPKLIAAAIVAKHPEAFGFEPAEFEFQEPLAYDEVKLADAFELDQIADAASLPVEELQQLNPELNRACTPPASPARPYVLRVPRGAGPRTTAGLEALPKERRLSFQIYRVQRGDTLSAIARRHSTVPEAILKLNQLREVRRLRMNAELLVPVPHVRSAAALAHHAARARRGGFVALRPSEEIPAGVERARRSVKHGSIQRERVAGRTRITYGVRRGDSLWTLSERFDCSMDDLRRWNRLSTRAVLKAGDRLIIWPGRRAVLARRGE